MSQAWHPFYWADYLADTGHLTLAQHGAYVLLMGHYYRSGKPLPANAEQLHKVCRAFAHAERAAIAWVLENLFQLDKTEQVYRHKRIDQELSKTADISQKRRAAAMQKHSKHSAKAPVLHTQSQPQSQSQEDQKRKPGDDYDSGELGPKEIDGQVHEIALLHPRIDDAFNLPYDIAIQIAEAVARDGRDVVWTGTKALADAVAGWPVTELKFIPSPQKFFRESNYRKPLEFWTRSNGNGNKRQTSAVEQRVSGNREVLSEALRTHVAQRVGHDGDKLQDGDGAQAKRRVSAGAL